LGTISNLTCAYVSNGLFQPPTTNEYKNRRSSAGKVLGILAESLEHNDAFLM